MATIREVQRIKDTVDWTQFPEMEAVFRHRPAVNIYWVDLVEFIRMEKETGYGNLDKFPKLQAASHQFMSELSYFVNIVLQNGCLNRCL